MLWTYWIWIADIDDMYMTNYIGGKHEKIVDEF